MNKLSFHGHQALGLLTALFGVILVYRWIFQNEAIARLIPDSVNMGLNSPLLFLAGGTACLLFRPQRRAAVLLLRLCGALLLVLPGLTLIQHAFDVSLGIDFVRAPTAPSEGIPHPGRMAPNTSIAFFCGGLALLLMQRREEARGQARLAGLAIAVIMLIGFAALAGHFLRLQTLYRVASFNVMLMPTAAGMSLFGCALWLLQQRMAARRSRSTESYQRRITRRAIGVLTLVALAAGVAGFSVMRTVFDKTLSENMSLSISTNAISLANVLEDKLAFHQTIANRPIVQQHFSRIDSNPRDREAGEFLRATAHNLLSTGLSGARLLGADGHVLAGSGTLVHARAALAYPLQGTGQPAVLLWQDGYLLHTETRVVQAGKTVGTIIAEQRLPAFDRLLQRIQANDDATDAVLCGRLEGRIACAPSRRNPDVFSFPPAEVSGAPPLPVERALAGQSGVMPVTDPHNVPVIAAYTPLPDFGLGLLVKIDRDALYAPLKDQVQLLAGLLVLLVALGTMIQRLAVQPLLDHIVRDKNRIKAILEKLAGSEKRLRAITDNLPVLISYIDREQKYGFCNKTFENWTRVSQKQALRQPVAQVLGTEKYEARRVNIERALAGERVEYELATPGGDGIVRQLHTTYVPDIGADGTVLGIYTISVDVTALHTAQRQLEQMARFDALTGLPNRYQMNEKLVEAIARSRRAGTPMAVMFLDLDHFKAINDSLGHGAGDAALKEFGRRLKASVRETDTVCRLAGDEFVIILEQLGSADDAREVARKILANTGAPCEIAGQPLRLGTSIGIAYCQGQPLMPDALIDQADQALYQVKQMARGSFRLVLC